MGLRATVRRRHWATSAQRLEAPDQARHPRFFQGQATAAAIPLRGSPSGDPRDLCMTALGEDGDAEELVDVEVVEGVPAQCLGVERTSSSFLMSRVRVSACHPTSVDEFVPLEAAADRFEAPLEGWMLGTP